MQKFSYLHEFDLYELNSFFLVSTAEHSMTFSDAEEQINDAELL